MSNKNSLQLNKKLTSTNIFILVCFIATSIIILMPLWNKSQIFGHDAWYHITRIEALKVQILDGVPFSRINYFFNQGLGYASSLCYPDLLLYIPAIFRICGLDINVSYNIFLMLIGLACFFTTFYAAKKMTKNDVTATICAMMFTLCNYHLDNIMTRGSVGEIQAFIFIPLVIYGLYNFLYEDFSNPAVMAVGFIGLVLSHTITTFLVVIFYAIIIAINFPKIYKETKKIIKLFSTAGIVLLCTAFYWIPFIELMARMDLKVSHSTKIVAEQAVNFKYLLADVKMADGKVIGLGVTVFMLLILRIALNKKQLDDDRKVGLLKTADLFMICGLFASFMATDLFPWELFTKTPLNSIQFAWRLYIIASVFLSFASCSYLYLVLPKDKKKVYSICTVLACIICIFGYAHTLTIKPSYKHRSPTYFTETKNYDDGFDGTVRTGGAEWLPYVVTKNKANAFNQCDIVKDQDGNKYSYDKQGTTVTVELDNTKSKIKTIQVPLVYYIGYDAKFTDENGEVTKLDIQGAKKSGLLVAEIPENAKGTLEVYYKGTLLQKLSFLITLITILSFIAIKVYKKVKKTN